MNDAPKIWALCFPLLALGGMQGANYFLLVALVAGAMGAGSLLAGRKVSVVLAERVTRMNPAQSLGANLTAALLVGAATAFALPVSTTHVSSGAIIGVGLEGPKKNLRWRVVGEMVSAWVVTLPLTAAVAASFYLLLRQRPLDQRLPPRALTPSSGPSNIKLTNRQVWLRAGEE